MAIIAPTVAISASIPAEADVWIGVAVITRVEAGIVIRRAHVTRSIVRPGAIDRNAYANPN